MPLHYAVGGPIRGIGNRSRLRQREYSEKRSASMFGGGGPWWLSLIFMLVTMGIRMLMMFLTPAA